MTPVHPHACGEHQGVGPHHDSQNGSSPRLWGTQGTSWGWLDVRWFIPTPVGNTGDHGTPEVRVAVHPHACGEHKAGGEGNFNHHGSSPRLWGTLRHLHPDQRQRRFIPTPVGNTLPPARASCSLPVHPHACGEHGSNGNNSGVACGSSPRLWGTRRGDSLIELQGRFIPTPVGNTPRSNIMPNGETVHPHACGEHATTCGFLAAANGSSPRLWGTQQCLRLRLGP